MLSFALYQLLDRYITTLILLVVGLLNALNWQFVAVFVVCGLVFDIRYVRSVGRKDKPNDGSTFRAGWRRLGYAAICFVGIGFGLLLTTGQIASRRPEIIGVLGPFAFAVTSPFIALLRDHYPDLARNGFLDRANLVAINYSGLFLLFYITLVVELLAIRRTFPCGGIFQDIDIDRIKKHWLLALCLIGILLLALGYIAHVVTYTSIDYNDENLRRRHINTNIARYDSLFYDLQIYLGTFCFFFPLVHQFCRALLGIYRNSVNTRT